MRSATGEIQKIGRSKRTREPLAGNLLHQLVPPGIELPGIEERLDVPPRAARSSRRRPVEGRIPDGASNDPTHRDTPAVSERAAGTAWAVLPPEETAPIIPAQGVICATLAWCDRRCSCFARPG